MKKYHSKVSKNEPENIPWIIINRSFKLPFCEDHGRLVCPIRAVGDCMRKEIV